MINSDTIYDSWLVLQCRSGDKKATALLVKKWHRKLCKQAFWYTKDMDDAKDIAQDCWNVIFKKLDGLKDPYSFGSWALSIVTRKAIDSLRKQKRETNKLEKYRDANSRINADKHDNSRDSLIGLLRRSILELPDDHQTVLHLFYLEDFSIKQISDIMQLPSGTIKSRLFTAREKLKIIIKSKNHEE